MCKRTLAYVRQKSNKLDKLALALLMLSDAPPTPQLLVQVHRALVDERAMFAAVREYVRKATELQGEQSEG
eukprot:3877340-Pleurochrysis_carterae.AAC.4